MDRSKMLEVAETLQQRSTVADVDVVDDWGEDRDPCLKITADAFPSALNTLISRGGVVSPNMDTNDDGEVTFKVDLSRVAQSP